jgi:hypothetical protein
LLFMSCCSPVLIMFLTFPILSSPVPVLVITVLSLFNFFPLLFESDLFCHYILLSFLVLFGDMEDGTAHRVYRVPDFLSSLPNLPPSPPPRVLPSHRIHI